MEGYGLDELVWRRCSGMYLSDELRHGGGGRLPSRAQDWSVGEAAGVWYFSRELLSSSEVARCVVVVCVMSVLANGKGLRRRLCCTTSKTSERRRRRARARWRAWPGAGWLAARITNHPTISHINMATTLDRRTSIDPLTVTPIYISRS